MGFGTFDQAGMSVVAYAQVAADGTSGVCNSGISTSRVAPGSGSYYIDLPAGKLEADANVFFSIESIGNITMHNITPMGAPDQRRYLVAFLDPTGTSVDTAFTIIVYRTLLASP